MHPLEIKDCLASMSIFIDTREQPSARAEKRYQLFGCEYSRRKLEYGDYCYNFQLPDGRELFEEGKPILPPVYVERKMNLDELAQCFTHSRERFEAEFKRAVEAGAKGYLLIENASFENMYAGKYRSKFNSKAFTASLWAWVARFNLTPVMCKAETSGRIIKDILYRELKERLTNGAYDL